MKRREFITLVGGTAATWPVASRAQQSKMPIIGFLSSVSQEQSESRVRAFRQGLSERGFIDGNNVAIEYRWANGQNDRLSSLATELARLRVTVIVAISDSSALAAKSATTTTPIIFTVGNDPINHGLVSSLNRPGGNLTGVTNLNVELGAKRLELLHAMVPSASKIGLLINPSSANAASALQNLPRAARGLGLEMPLLHAATVSEIDKAIESLPGRGVGALLISADNFYNSRSEQLGSLTLRHTLPAIFQTREFATSGGLMAYGGSPAESYRLVGVYTGRVLKGEKPSDLPVIQATKVELIVNLKTAKALGLTVPPTLLARADEVIE